MFCRLEAYERNFNFGKCHNPVPPEYVMKLPDAMVYKDLNSDRKFAKVEIHDLILYLGLFEKKLDQTPINLYKEKYLCYMRLFKSDEENCYYLKSGCRVEMKKSVVYTVDVCISFDRQILEAQCECGAGMGPNAHCKHVAAVIYGAHVFSSKGSVLVENTCTEKLQSFDKKCPEDIYLNQFGLITMTDEQISRNEQQTRGQQANKHWHLERQKRLQSSNFGRICKFTDRSDPEKVALEIIDPKVFKSKATEYGKRYEKIAIKEYERETECSVTDCGIFVSKHLPFLGSSPDGVVSDKLIVEVKCLFSARDKTVSARTVPYLTVTDDNLHLNHNHNDYYQV
ncbi:Hypothetical predicted protein [Mytilus galloprovincialis]|uniref:SWIM-type domain-containing protein n=1 Tax=Mytilus galloprovincialis TaxID=29158 RepID=A0A8B6CIT7_MYTGA|nr:Hypothetical predicted protein [Mytilus galloprovincialis]